MVRCESCKKWNWNHSEVSRFRILGWIKGQGQRGGRWEDGRRPAFEKRHEPGFPFGVRAFCGFGRQAGTRRRAFSEVVHGRLVVEPVLLAIGHELVGPIDPLFIEAKECEERVGYRLGAVKAGCIQKIGQTGL